MQAEEKLRYVAEHIALGQMTSARQDHRSLHIQSLFSSYMGHFNYFHIAVKPDN